MKRDLLRLSAGEYDLVVIGGGIYGACIAWEAVSRGLSVALLEKGDFASATSANSLKTIHGGFRYLQHADFQRMRQSMRERQILMQIAPHLVHPLPVLVPTYWHGLKGREAFKLAIAINDLLSFDRNQPFVARQALDPEKHIPNGKVLSRQQCLEILPGIDPNGLNGGAVFYDGQVYNSERLVLAFLKAAEQAGAALANYAAVNGFLTKDGRVQGVRVEDRLQQEPFDVRSRMVINASGPWISQLLGQLHGIHPPVPRLAKAINLVTRRRFSDYAVGLMGNNGYQDKNAVVRKNNSLLFIAPWRDYSLIGTSYKPYADTPDELRVTSEDIDELLEAFNLAYPSAKLNRSDISYVHAGLLPQTDEPGANGAVQLANHYQIADHRKEGYSGLLSVSGVKYTTARQVAQHVVSLASSYLNTHPVHSVSSVTPLPGGHIENFETYLQAEIQRSPCRLGPAAIRNLVYNYGSDYTEVLQYIPDLGVGNVDQFQDSAVLTEEEQVVLQAQTLYGIRNEMAQKLGDIIFRRTELGTAEYPGPEALHFCAQVMAGEVKWGPGRIEQEVDEINANFSF